MNNTCDSCLGTGIGWNGPDSYCNCCGGRGYHMPDSYKARQDEDRWASNHFEPDPGEVAEDLPEWGAA